MRGQMNQIMAIIQHNPKLANIKPDVLLMAKKGNNNSRRVNVPLLGVKKVVT